MDDVGSEIGQKMRSAIKAKLTELGCYVDDELPDYVMVMVANKRTRAQMEDDLQLFLGDNTELFVNWLHQVLKKLQEVTVTAPLKTAEKEKSKERSLSKEHKSKDKKDKSKKNETVKKAKKKEKEKGHRKKEEKKSKKKSKHHEMIRPNVPPLLMNMEKESEPSITDVFAGQILKNHGITIDSLKDDVKNVDKKPTLQELKRPILPVIDPATISSQIEQEPPVPAVDDSDSQVHNKSSVSSTEAPREEQIKEIEAKIQGLKQKLAEQLDSMSDDEDFLNIRTEAEELMNDFADDVFHEISQPPLQTPPINTQRSLSPPLPKKSLDVPANTTKEVEVLPQIELKLPKRPVRERLGAREEPKSVSQARVKETQRRTESPERFTPEREPDIRPQTKSARNRLGDAPEPQKRSSVSEDASDKPESSSKRLTSKVSVLESRPRTTCASVVRVRPRPRGAAPPPALLLRAVADAHRSLLNIPPKIDPEPQKVKRALVLPMRRCVDAQKIVIQVPGVNSTTRTDSSDNISLGEMDSEDDKVTSDADKDEYVPKSITKKIINDDYVPLTRTRRTSSGRDEPLTIDTITIHNPTVDKDKNTQFIVTMDGFNPNAFLAKKLMTEGLLNDDEATIQTKETQSVLKTKEIAEKPKDKHNSEKIEEKPSVKSRLSDPSDVSIPTKASDAQSPRKRLSESSNVDDTLAGKTSKKRLSESSITIDTVVSKTAKKRLSDSSNENDAPTSKTAKKSLSDASNASDTSPSKTAKKRLSDTSVESDTQIVIKTEDSKSIEKRKSVEAPKTVGQESPPVKRRKASPIVFDVGKKEKAVERARERTESASSDNHVIVTTANAHKYDALPSLSQPTAWCRAFPSCRYGPACAFQHPRCRFAAACTRRGCMYAHSPNTTPAVVPTVASHVVPVANYKSISPAAATICKFYPNCTSPACHYYHPTPKPCRYGAACLNKPDCNFYHADSPPNKYRYPV